MARTKQCERGCAPIARGEIEFPTNPMRYTYDVRNAFNIVNVFENGEYTDIFCARADEFFATNCRRCYNELPTLRQTTLSAQEITWLKDAAATQNPSMDISAWSIASLKFRYFKTRIVNFCNEDGDAAEPMPSSLMGLPEPCHFQCLMHSAAKSFLTDFANDRNIDLADVNTRVATRPALQTFMKNNNVFAERILDIHMNFNGVEEDAWERGKVLFAPTTGMSHHFHFDQDTAQANDLSIISEAVLGDVVAKYNEVFRTISVDVDLDISGECEKTTETVKSVGESLHMAMIRLNNEKLLPDGKKVEVALQLNVVDMPKSEVASFTMRTSFDYHVKRQAEVTPEKAGEMGFEMAKTPRKYPRLGDVAQKYGSSAELSIGLDTPPKSVKTGVKMKSVSPISTADADAAAMDMTYDTAANKPPSPRYRCGGVDYELPVDDEADMAPPPPLETDPTCPCPPPKCEKPVDTERETRARAAASRQMDA